MMAARRQALGRVLVSLALGAAVTLALAWGLAMLRPEGMWLPAASDTYLTPGEGEVWHVRRTGVFGGRGVDRHVIEAMPQATVASAPWWSDARTPPTAGEVARQEATQGDWMITEVAWGWPLPAMRYEYHWRTHPVGFSGRLRYFEEMRGGLMVKRPAERDLSHRWRSEMQALPLRPVALGFIGNTLIFAAATLGLAAARRWALAVHRGRRGRCRACGYDLRGQPAGESRCPECGAIAIPSPA